MMPLSLRRAALQPIRIAYCRSVSTLEGNPFIFVFPDQKALSAHLLSLLPTDPPTPELAVGTTSKLPPSSTSLRENAKFSSILQAVIAENAYLDPDVISQAKAMASASGAGLGSVISRSGGGGGASDQGGAGGAGRGGWVHVSDQRNPPDYGRIAWPEDMFGSVEVDGSGNFVDGTGNYQPSGTYRMVTREGILGLSPFLRKKLIERLKVEEANIRN